MLFLVLHVILMSGFGLLLKDARNRDHQLNPIGFFNYLTAFVISLWAVWRGDGFAFHGLTFLLGAANGVTYATGFVLFTSAMALTGVVVTTAVVRLSMVVPIVAALLFWDEALSSWQAMGLLLTCASLPLLANRANHRPGARPEASAAIPTRALERGGVGLGLLLLALLFLNAGLSRLSMKAFNEFCPPDEKLIYLVFLFAVTTCVYGVVCVRQRLAPSRRELAYGVAIGLCNVGGSGLFLVALDHVPALVAFPVSSAGGLIVTTLAGMLLLGERLNRPSRVGVGVGVAALALLNVEG